MDTTHDGILARIIERSRLESLFLIGGVYRETKSSDLIKIHAFDDQTTSTQIKVRRFRTMKNFPIACFLRHSKELYQVGGYEFISASDLIVDRCTELLLLTNTVFPDLVRADTQTICFRCRWMQSELGNTHRGSLVRLCSSEVPADSQGSFRARTTKVIEKDLLDAWRGTISSSERQYTFADGFSGAGGSTRGASQAGLRIMWGFDNNKAALASWRLNFPNAIAWLYSAEQITTVSDNLQVDILHFSPPCQGFSGMNTAPNGGQHGDANRDLTLSIPLIIRKVRPRIVTMEQVPAILYDSKRPYFEALIRTFVEDLGFSVRWEVLNCERHGVPATRKRLFIIASCPGQHLPESPEPDATGLERPVSYYLAARNTAPEFHQVFRGTLLTCGRPKRRDGTSMTNSELAAIQSFPPTHLFVGSDNVQLRQSIPTTTQIIHSTCLLV